MFKKIKCVVIGVSVSLGLIQMVHGAMNDFSNLSYDDKVDLFDKLMSAANGYDAKAEIARNFIKSSRYSGNSRLLNMFKNFEDNNKVDFDCDGVLKTIKRLAVDNKNVVSGASRELVYYQKLYNSPELFANVRLGVSIPGGNGGFSDMDIRYFDKLSGKEVWAEIKNHGNLTSTEQLKSQIKRMSQFDGHRLLICRGRVSAGVKKYAKQHNVKVLQNTKSQSLVNTVVHATKPATIGKLDTKDITPRSARSVKTKKSAATARAAKPVADSKTISSTRNSFAKAGRSSSRLGSTSAPTATKNLGTTVAKNAGRAGAVIALACAGYEVYNMSTGKTTIRNGTSNLAGSVVGVLGCAGGAKVGAVTGAGIGAVGGPVGIAVGGAIGAATGAAIGGFAGSYVGSKVAEEVYDHFEE